MMMDVVNKTDRWYLWRVVPEEMMRGRCREQARCCRERAWEIDRPWQAFVAGGREHAGRRTENTVRSWECLLDWKKGLRRTQGEDKMWIHERPGGWRSDIYDQKATWGLYIEIKAGAELGYDTKKIYKSWRWRRGAITVVVEEKEKTEDEKR